ncbi:MAG: thioesterase family protein [Candidatus Parcubacteria bacterium]|nr:thioesterase family protein [Burkholderiales bacterium]
MTAKKIKEGHALLRQVMEEYIAFNKYLGLKVESFDIDAPKLRFDMRPELVGNPSRQILHGGVISATLDVAGGFSIMLSIASESPVTPTSFPNMGTIDLRVDYLRPGRGKHFIATARIVRKGSRIAVVHMELHNDEGELIATGGAAYVVG